MKTNDTIVTPSKDLVPWNYWEDCTPGTYRCFGNQLLAVCNWDGSWDVSNHCCGPNSCVNGITPGTAFCKCKSKRRATSSSTETALKQRSDDPTADVVTSLAPCSPSTYKCFVREVLAVCRYDGTWELSNNCCGEDSCFEGNVPGTAFCRCSPKARTVSPEAFEQRSNDLVSPGDPQTPGICTPGHYWCVDSQLMLVCGWDGTWEVSNSCGGPGCCKKGKVPGTAFCKCPTLGPGSKEEVLENTSTKAIPEVATSGPPCTPGTFRCHKERYLEVCTVDDKWKLSNLCCGEGSCEEGPSPGTALCKCSPKPRSASSMPTIPNSGPEDPNELEFCMPGRFCCGDQRSRVYTCNKGDWVPSAKCTAGINSCKQGEHGEAWCYGGVVDESKEAEEGLTTLATVAKKAASTASA